MAEPPIQIRVYPPERRRRGGVVLYGPGCCCCCCCLHVAGSVIGAMIGSASANHVPTLPTPPPDALEKFRSSSQAPASDRVTEGPDEGISPADFGLTEAVPSEEMPAQPAIPSRDVRVSQGLSGAGLYWLTVLVLTPIACVLVASQSGSADILVGILAVVFGLLPAVQLAASAIAALLVFLWPPDDRPARWRSIGWITLWSVIGTLVGLLVMSPCLLKL